jgi:hypothetical protein
MDSDAYATGQALVALAESGAITPAIRFTSAACNSC